jgi:prevent-host-death family protein
MTEIDAFEAKSILSSLLDRVEQGEDIVITRRGKPVARLTPYREPRDLTAARAAANHLLESRQGVTLGAIPLKELIETGRR